MSPENKATCLVRDTLYGIHREYEDRPGGGWDAVDEDDSTSQKQAEKSLSEAEKQVEALYKSAKKDIEEARKTLKKIFT